MPDAGQGDQRLDDNSTVMDEEKELGKVSECIHGVHLHISCKWLEGAGYALGGPGGLQG